MSQLKVNYIGIVGGILAFISLALPWWTVSLSSSYVTIGGTYNWYLNNAGTYGTGMNVWYSWVALVLVILAGIIGLVGSIMPHGKKILVGGGLLAVLAIIIFPVGLQMDLSSHGAPFSLFSSSSVSTLGYSYTYSTYLSFGFWLALVSMIIIFVASTRKPVEAIPPPPPPPPT